jgi:5-methylcytosine-specific restriction endonuclease McrA
MNVLNQPVLVLNALWQPISPKNVKEALVAMLGGKDGENPPAMAIDQEFEVDAATGEVDYSNMIYANPVTWDEWVKLPIRSYDLVIHTGHMEIRAPRVIVQTNFSKMPLITPRPTKDAIRRRDGGVCQYTGKLIGKSEGNIDHVIPRAQGGKNTFENMVWAEKNVNSKKADKTPDQAGLKLIRKPVSPKSVPLSSTIDVAHHPSWVPFMTNVREIREHKARV